MVVRLSHSRISIITVDAAYHHLADIALDLVAAPASQAFVESIFSVRRMLTQGRRNYGMLNSLEMQIRLKLKAKLFA
jgi:hypothetical protein